MIYRIQNVWLRRAALVASIPTVVPVGVLVCGMAHMGDVLLELVRHTIPACWRRRA